MKEYRDYEAKPDHCPGIAEDFTADRKYFRDELVSTCAPNAPREGDSESVDPGPEFG